MEELLHKIETLRNILLNQKKVLTVEELSEYSGYAEGYIYKLTSTKHKFHIIKAIENYSLNADLK